MSNDPRDRREAERHLLSPMYHGVTVMRPGASREVPDGHLYDLSTTGARLEVDDAYEAGDDLTLALHLPGVPEVAVVARIVRVYAADDDPAARRIAVRFTEYRTEWDRQRLAQYLGERPMDPRRADDRASLGPLSA